MPLITVLIAELVISGICLNTDQCEGHTLMYVGLIIPREGGNAAQFFLLLCVFCFTIKSSVRPSESQTLPYVWRQCRHGSRERPSVKSRAYESPFSGRGEGSSLNETSLCWG